jgi:hypothetical protein
MTISDLKLTGGRVASTLRRLAREPFLVCGFFLKTWRGEYSDRTRRPREDFGGRGL